MRRAPLLALALACAKPDAAPPPEPYPTEGERPVATERFHFDDGSVRLGPARSGGRGVALLDVDDDGWPDATLTHSEGVTVLRGGARGFTPWTQLALPWPRGVAWADIDDDGDRDLYVSGSLEHHALYRNDGGDLVEITGDAGIPETFPTGGEAPSFGDLDGDGDLDLFVALGARSQASIAEDRANGIEVTLGEMGAPDRLFWNDGGTFRAESGGPFSGPPGGETFQASLFDADGDGDQDLFAVDDFRADRLLVNAGAGVFEDRSVDVLPDGGRFTTSIMGIALGDLDQDGRLDLYGSQKQGDLVYLGFDLQGVLHNDWPTLIRGDDATVQTTGWGAALDDFDHDGDLDLFRTANFDTTFVTGGSLGRVGVNLLFEHTRPEAEGTSPPTTVPATRALVDVSATAGEVMDRPIDGWGLATGDVDRDGDLDVLVGVDGSHEGLDDEPDAVRSALLLINRGGGAASRAALLVRLRQPGRKNRFAVGARADLLGQGIRSSRVVQVGQSYLSQHDDALHFGLGDYTAAPAIRVRWPGGHETVWLGLSAGEHRLERPADDAANCCRLETTPSGETVSVCGAAPSTASCLEAQAFALGQEAACDAGCAAWAACCSAVDVSGCAASCRSGPPPASTLACMATAACADLPACLAFGAYAPGNTSGAQDVGPDACPLTR